MSINLLAPVFPRYESGEFFIKSLPNFTIEDPNSILCKDFVYLKDLPIAVSDSVSCYDKNKKMIYLFGGNDDSGVLSTVLVYKPSDDDYILKNDFPKKIKKGLAIAEVNPHNGGLYVVCCDESFIYLYLYDEINDSWKELSKIDFELISSNKPDFIIGGFSIINNIFSFYASNTANKLNYSCSFNIDDFSTNIVESSISTIFNASYVKTDSTLFFVNKDDSIIYSLNLDTMAITNLLDVSSTLPDGKFNNSPTIIFIGGKVYFIGGISVSGDYKKDIYCFDLSLNTFIKFSDFPINISSTSFTSTTDSSYIFGGTSDSSKKTIKTCFRCDLLTTEIYYTTDGTPVLDSENNLSPVAKKYSGPFTLHLPAKLDAVVVPVII